MESRISEEKFGVLVLVAVIVFMSLMLLSGGCSAGTNNTDPANYNLVKADAGVVKITEEVNVRSQPVREEHPDDLINTSNSYGKTKMANFTFVVSKVYRTDENLDKQNGEFIGLMVDDVLATPEGREWFPEGIKDDPDGIVWINHQYIDVVA